MISRQLPWYMSRPDASRLTCRRPGTKRSSTQVHMRVSVRAASDRLLLLLLVVAVGHCCCRGCCWPFAQLPLPLPLPLAQLPLPLARRSRPTAGVPLPLCHPGPLLLHCLPSPCQTSPRLPAWAGGWLR